MLLRALCTIGSILLSANLSAADAKKPCYEDQIKFCNGKMNKSCLMGHLNEVTAGCKSWLEANTVGKAVGIKNKAVGNVADTKAACSTEITQLCAQAALVGGGYMKCLKQNYEKLSAGCKQAVDQSKDLR